MAVMTLSISVLKQAKNAVIGNPTAKRDLARDDGFIQMLVNCVNDPAPYIDPAQSSQDDIRVEAAHVVASLSYGSSEALKGLLKFNAIQAFLFAISNFKPQDPPALRSAFARALRALAVAVSDAVGPSQGGLQIHPSDAREEATVALNSLFEQTALGIYLPLLTDSNAQICTSISQLLAATLRQRPYRAIVSDWVPPNERSREHKGKRGWEKAESANSPSRQGGWVARQLVTLLQRKDMKLQEAVLGALGSLAQENPTVASKLAKAAPDQTTTLSVVLSMAKSRVASLQLAACYCATNIIRAGIPASLLHLDSSSAMTVTHVLTNLISSDAETSHTRAKACFTLHHLYQDDKHLCRLVYERGTLSKLAALVKEITPNEPPTEWDIDEPESVSALREAALTAIATISMFEDDIRSCVTDTLLLTPYIHISLTHRHIGVRYAACQCVRALSRAVSVLRTNIVDSGLGLAVYQLFRKTDEDVRVMQAASAVICNLLMDASPLRTVLLDQGVIDRLVQMMRSGEPDLVLNALWAFKNLVYKSSIELKRRVMNGIGWAELTSLFMGKDVRLQEQAFYLVRNLADTEEGIDMVFAEVGSDLLLGALSQALDSENDDVLAQAVYCLGNIANSPTYHRDILAHPRILSSLRTCLSDAKVEVRRPATACILELVRTNPRCYHDLHAAGIDSTLRHMCEFSSLLMAASPVTRMGMGLQMGVEEDREVKEKAREALHLIEISGEMGM